MNQELIQAPQHVSPAPGSPAERTLLEQRARELARQPLRDAERGECLEIVAFTMAHERYGVETRFVREVQQLRELTPIPGTPPFVLGILNLRGHVVSLVDLKKFFSLPDRGLSDINHVVLLSCAEMEFGILADTLLGVRRLPAEELQGALSTFSGRRKDYLLGVARDGTVVLDARQILNDPGMVVRDHATD